MDLNRISIVLPCDQIEDLTLNPQADEAAQMLAAWSAPWHPTLLATVRSMPRFAGYDTLPEDLKGHLVFLAEESLKNLDDDWLSRATEAGAEIIHVRESRQEVVSDALKIVSPDAAAVDAELTADFLALGLGHFLVELLTRHLRYMTSLDEEAFEEAVLAAADAATGGDMETAKDKLQLTFDLLHQGREYFFPVDAYLLDLTLVASTTIGEPLRRELAGRTPSNLLIAADVVEKMAQDEPETLAALKQALADGKAGLIGGEVEESELPLMPPNAIEAELKRGSEAYEKHLGKHPTVFGRRRFGLTPVLPGILKRQGFAGALHFTLDDGRFPTSDQSRIEWEGLDGNMIEAVARMPVDISSAAGLFRLAETLGDAMDTDNVATAVLAHWPGGAAEWYEDLLRISEYAPVLGSFHQIENYFEETHMSGRRERYAADEYRSPYLRQDVAREKSDPISRWVRFYADNAATEAVEAVETLTAMVTSKTEANTDVELDDSLKRLTQSLTGKSTGADGLLLVNPCSFSRRMCVKTPDFATPAAIVDPVRAADDNGAVVDVPAMGFAWIGPGGDQPSQPKRRRREPPMAEENVLRNDFFELKFDPHTGAIRSISDYYSRDARIAQQLGLRTPQPGETDPAAEVNYSIMAADEMTITSAGPVLAEMTVRGRLVGRNGDRVAGFTQITRVWRGSRVIEIDIDLDIEKMPEGDPWNSYYAARFAWSDATADTARSVHLAVSPTDLTRLEAPHFFDLSNGKRRTTLLFGGLPYHRRFGLRKLDSLLVVPGETSRKFRLGIAFDSEHPMSQALDFTAPPTVQPSATPSNPSGWLFHLDRRNMIATSWQPIATADRVEGFRVRLLETEGRRTPLVLQTFRPLQSAVNKSTSRELEVSGEKIAVDLGGNETVDIEARFATP